VFDPQKPQNLRILVHQDHSNVFFSFWQSREIFAKWGSKVSKFLHFVGVERIKRDFARERGQGVVGPY
jgi:hypothetical protein